jgi:6-pyruvoyltetrahydropterin/6-carboxytetrahydropterin synthase
LDLTLDVDFDSAHRLPRYDGPCVRLHGHRYRLRVTITGPVDPKTGMVMDFGALKRIVEERVLSVVDHRDLNGLLENPTAENMVVLFYEKLEGALPGLKELKLWETPEYSVVYRKAPRSPG